APRRRENRPARHRDRTEIPGSAASSNDGPPTEKRPVSGSEKSRGFAQRPERPCELRQLMVGIQPARVRQYPQSSVHQTLRLSPKPSVPPAKRCPICSD